MEKIKTASEYFVGKYKLLALDTYEISEIIEILQQAQLDMIKAFEELMINKSFGLKNIDVTAEFIEDDKTASATMKLESLSDLFEEKLFDQLEDAQTCNDSTCAVNGFCECDSDFGNYMLKEFSVNIDKQSITDIANQLIKNIKGE